MGFAQWNERLLAVFFGEFASGERVRLSVSRDLLDAEFADLGGASEFVRIIRHGPDWDAQHASRFQQWLDPRNFLGRAIGLYNQWRQPYRRHQKYVQPLFDAPPYLPYLCFLCYGWTIEVDGHANNFYDRIERLYPGHGLKGKLNELYPLWEGLEEWSSRHNGRFGIFLVEQLGGMPWVGIPKAQVILTATHLDSLPLLFQHLSLDPAMPPTGLALREALLEREQLSRHCLGSSVIDEIHNNESIGQATLQQLLQHLESWDGQAPEGDIVLNEERSGSGRHNSKERGRILFALRPDGENEHWRSEVHLTTDDLPNGVVRLLHGRTWQATLVDGHAGPFCGERVEHLLDGATLIGDSEDKTYDVSWSDEVDGETAIRASSASRKVMVLRWHGAVLLQQPRLPSEGETYLIICDTLWSAIQDWCARLPMQRRPTISVNLPQAGLPPGWRLAHMSGLTALRDDEWSAFPDARDDRRLRPRVMTLRGGTRSRRIGIRRVYASYDLPKIVLDNEPDLELRCAGARIVEVGSNQQLPAWLPRIPASPERIFRVIPTKDSAVISLLALRRGVEARRISIGVAGPAEDGDHVLSDTFSLGNLGEPLRDRSGALGPHVPSNASPWAFRDGPFGDWDCLTGSVDLSQPGYLFLEWLTTRGSVAFSRTREFIAEQLASRGLWNAPHRELRALSLLAHLEVEADSRGRWTAVHPVPVRMFPLPFRRHGQYQAVLSGTYSRLQAGRVISSAQSHNVRVELHPTWPSGYTMYYLVPPRLTLIGPDLDGLAAIACEAEVAWSPVPPAWSYASWSGGLTDWINSIPTFPESGPTATATYRPREFRTRDGDEWPAWGTHKLARFEDQVTRRHFQYTLVCREDAAMRHAYVAQRAWATWYVHCDVMVSLMKCVGHVGEFDVPIAYDIDTKTVVVPLELELPHVLGRALALCSGLVPEVMGPDQFSAYANAASAFTPGFAYRGYCLAYRYVPREVVEPVLRRLGAAAQIFPPLPELNLPSG